MKKRITADLIKDITKRHQGNKPFKRIFPITSQLKPWQRKNAKAMQMISRLALNQITRKLTKEKRLNEWKNKIMRNPKKAILFTKILFSMPKAFEKNFKQNSNELFFPEIKENEMKKLFLELKKINNNIDKAIKLLSNEIILLSELTNAAVEAYPKTTSKKQIKARESTWTLIINKYYAMLSQRFGNRIPKRILKQTIKALQEEIIEIERMNGTSNKERKKLKEMISPK